MTAARIMDTKEVGQRTENSRVSPVTVMVDIIARNAVRSAAS